MIKKIAIIALGLVMALIIIFGGFYIYGYYWKNKIDDLATRNLPAAALDQHEFPKKKVESMMKQCVYSAVKRNGDSDLEDNARSCGCRVNGWVHAFTLTEYTTAGYAHWDPKTVPEFAKKNTDILVKCEQNVFK